MIAGRPAMTLTSTVLDSIDPAELGNFYHRLLGWPLDDSDPTWVTVRPAEGGPGLSFQLEPRYTRPSWPAADGEQQIVAHLDFEVTDLGTSGAHAVAAGAILAEYQPQDDVRVYLDPEGHPFCLWIRT